MIPQMDEGVDPDVAQVLQAGLDTLNALVPPQHIAPNFLGNFRHLCMAARQAKMTGKGVSTAITLKEKYIVGWEVSEVTDGTGFVVDRHIFAHTDTPGSTHAIIYREGKCVKCKDIARSDVGRVVLIADRPPVEGRVARA
jgi:hypothetical protein